MGLFDIFTKKKEEHESFELPPPPAPEAPSAEVKILSNVPDVEAIPELPAPAENHEEEPSMPEMPSEEPSFEPAVIGDGPIFISVQDYQETLNSINRIRNKLTDADELVKKVSGLRSKEAKEFQAYSQQLEDIHRKLSYVEDVIFAAG